MNNIKPLIQTMRPKQWAKNIFVFVGILFDQSLFILSDLLSVLITFVLLCMTASTIYLINDIVDVEKDRLHPKKKNRPIASGALSIQVARLVAIILPLIALGISFFFNRQLFVVLVLYLVLHIAYSFWLKQVVLLDIFAIALGFILRVIAGVVVIDVQNFSPWLYAFAGLLSLFLAVGKRRQELVMLGNNASNIRATYQKYNLELLDDLLRLTFISTGIMYTLYAVEAETLLVSPQFMLLTVPFVYYALFRYLYLIHVEHLGGDPTEVLFVDRPLQVSILLWGILTISLLYFL